MGGGGEELGELGELGIPWFLSFLAFFNHPISRLYKGLNSHSHLSHDSDAMLL